MYFKQFILNKLWVGFLSFCTFYPITFIFPIQRKKKYILSFSASSKYLPTDNSDTSLYKFSQIWISFIEFHYLKGTVKEK